MSNQSQLLGNISGFINTEVVLKASSGGTKYVSVLLGRGKDDRGRELASRSIVFFGADAELFSLKFKKGDLICVSKYFLQDVVEEGKSYATTFKIVGKEAVKIERSNNAGTTSQRPVQQASNSAPQQQPQPAPDFNSFDDDIPF